MSKKHRQKFLNYTKGNATRLANNLTKRIANDFNTNSQLLQNSLKEYTIIEPINNSNKVASIVNGNRRSRLLAVQRKDYFTYYGKIVTKRNLSPRYLPKYLIQDTYFSGKCYQSYLNDNKIKPATHNIVDRVNQPTNDEIRKIRNKLFLQRIEKISLKLVDNSRLKFDKYYKAINSK